MHAAIVKGLSFFLSGPPRIGAEWGLLKSISRRIWAYILLPLFFSYFGTSISLLPNPAIRRVLAEGRQPEIQKLPYAGQLIEGLDTEETKIKLGIAIVAALLIVSVIRILVVVYYPALVRTVVYVVLASSALAIYTGLADPDYYRNLFDSVFRLVIPNSLPVAAAGGIGVGSLTEYLLDRFPFRGEYP
jgi:hypothetical protein